MDLRGIALGFSGVSRGIAGYRGVSRGIADVCALLRRRPVAPSCAPGTRFTILLSYAPAPGFRAWCPPWGIAVGPPNPI